MARKSSKPVHHVQMTDGKRQIIQQLLTEYDINSAEDIQEALKDLLGGTIKEMMEAEMDEHLGYEKSERSSNDDSRNGYKKKTVNSSYGSFSIDVPQDRKSTFEPQVVKKRQKDISDIDHKIISMYAKGMTTRQISETIEDIYGFDVSEGFISDVTDKILPEIHDWQNRPLESLYPVVFVDAIHYSVKDSAEQFVERILLASFRLDSFNYFVAFFPELIHLNQSCGRMLKIAVNYSHAVACRIIKTCENSCFLAEVSRKLNASDSFISFGKFFHNIKSLIRRAVGNKEQIVFNTCTLQCLADGFGCILDIVFLIE